MADRSAIEWTDATWNPIRARRRDTGQVGFHCEHASEGCRNCYAETFNRRGMPNVGTGLAYKPAHRADVDIFLDEKVLAQPLHWRRPRKIFVGSMTDLFADFVEDAVLDRVFAVMALCPQHTFQPLTKRPARMRAYFETWFERMACEDPLVPHPTGLRSFSRLVDWSLLPSILPNVWAGTSCEDQPAADANIPDLLATPAAVRFVSAEPLLGPIDFTRIACPNGCRPADYCNRCYPDGRAPTGTFDALAGGEIDQIIVGGESGARARPMHPDWARDIRDQCATAGVAFHYKQTGEWKPLSDPGDDGFWPTDSDGCIRFTYSGERHDGGIPMQRVGKKRAGRLLDGVAHDGMPAR